MVPEPEQPPGPACVILGLGGRRHLHPKRLGRAHPHGVHGPHGTR